MDGAAARVAHGQQDVRDGRRDQHVLTQRDVEAGNRGRREVDLVATVNAREAASMLDLAFMRHSDGLAPSATPHETAGIILRDAYPHDHRDL